MGTARWRWYARKGGGLFSLTSAQHRQVYELYISGDPGPSRRARVWVHGQPSELLCLLVEEAVKGAKRLTEQVKECTQHLPEEETKEELVPYALRLRYERDRLESASKLLSSVLVPKLVAPLEEALEELDTLGITRIQWFVELEPPEGEDAWLEFARRASPGGWWGTAL